MAPSDPFNADSGTCPTEEELAGFAAGSSDSDQLRNHIDHCTTCKSWVNEVNQEGDLMGDLRRVLDAEAGHIPVGGSRGRSDAKVAVRGETPRPQIAGYQVLEELGRGGMGVVYLALQESTKRKVALKVLLEGPFASASTKRRFEREVELAAQLNHPHIVTILESGIASGRYYFAMSYVEGKRLDFYLAAHNPNLRERVALFGTICSAVNYAHQRGVIHRDLKPANILIDDQGQPHVLDFGLAKPIESADSESSAVTQLSLTGQVIGTLPYMSPEQTSGDPSDIDIRSDVYSLGVVFYQMLTGRYPYSVAGPAADVMRTIAEVRPIKPSAFGKPIDDEVETMVLKALAKERERRYQSAGALAEDVERYLAGDAIEAKRDSGWYVTRKLLRRYRAPVGVTCAFAIILLLAAMFQVDQRARFQNAQATEILHVSTQDVPAADRALASAPAGVERRVAELAGEYVASAIRAERVAGVRMAYRYQPEAFWESVDGGALWQNGEWLELFVDQPTEHSPGIGSAANVAGADGPRTARQQYISMCIAGQETVGHPKSRQSDAIDRARALVSNEAEPGVVMAAWWAAKAMGERLTWARSDKVAPDDLTGLDFVRLPGTEAFHRGTASNDPDALDDERPLAPAVAIEPFWMATTEVTWAAFEAFADDPASGTVLGKSRIVWMRHIVESAPQEDRDSVATGRLSLNVARAYCAWLNERAAGMDRLRRYRLPTEDEWEYACRAGNPGRFCYGDDARYLRFFANCNGNVQPYHLVARRLPNWFGLFDMHGGLWEWCDSRYPADSIRDPEQKDLELWVYRGGAYYSPAVRCRSAQRNRGAAHVSYDYHGLRLVMELDPP
ncbi:MAG: protein kinase [Planctomycetes bacterium]|nr:protein kinase [Planctomycetota bacterium]